MPWFLSDSLQDYSATAGGMVRARAGRNTILLDAAETLRARGLAAFGPDRPLFGWWQPPGERAVGAAFLHTPPLAGRADQHDGRHRGRAGPGAGQPGPRGRAG